MVDAEFDAQGLAFVVDHPKQRLELVADCLELAEPAVIRVVLERRCPYFGKNYRRLASLPRKSSDLIPLVSLGVSVSREQHVVGRRTKVSRRMTTPLPHRCMAGQEQSSPL
jgi:hypothetical protein